MFSYRASGQQRDLDVTKLNEPYIDHRIIGIRRSPTGRGELGDGDEL